MEEAEQLEFLTLGNRKTLFYFLICLSILSCHSSKKSDIATKEETIKEAMFNTSKFSPDTSINEILKLEDYLSANKFYEDSDKFSSVEYIRGSPVVLFLSRDNKEYLMAYQYEGNSKNAFSYFEIGYNDTLSTKFSNIKTNYENFYTESGLFLGISLKELISIKGNDYIDVYNNHTLIRYENLADLPFLDRYKMPGYNMEIELCDNIINKIKFGFEYP